MMGRMRGWAFLVLVGLAGCPVSEVPANQPPEEPGPHPSLELESRAVELGSAELRFRERVRREGFVSIRLKDSAEPVVLDVITRAPAVAPAAITLEPNVWLQVPVAMELSSVGRVSSVISFSSAERIVAAVSVELTASGTAAMGCLEVDESALHFGSLERGCPVKQRLVRLTNNCVVPHLLQDAEVVPRTAPFSISQQVSLPRRLGPGESWSGLVEFLGGEVGTHRADLHLQVDGMLGAAISLEGERTENGPRRFTFASPSPQVDLLVVIDNSPSFASRRAMVERKIVDDVANPAWYAGPLRVAVVGTSGQSLLWGPGLPWYENHQLDFDGLVANALDTLPPGDEFESCLGAAAQIADTATNFWRFGSRRLAVCITDAPDQTLSLSNAISTLADAGVRWDVIGPPFGMAENGCEVEGLDDGIHLAGTNALGGSVQSICSSTWQLKSLPLVPPMPSVFRLPVTPNFPISVFVDGQEVSAFDWNWEPTTRSLELHERPNHMVVVVEALTCGP